MSVPKALTTGRILTYIHVGVVFQTDYKSSLHWKFGV